MWQYLPVKSVSSCLCSQVTQDKAVWVVAELLPMLKRHGVALAEDSEQCVVVLELGEGFALILDPKGNEKPCITHYGHLAGHLVECESAPCKVCRGTGLQLARVDNSELPIELAWQVFCDSCQGTGKVPTEGD